MKDLNEMSGIIIGKAITVHRILGPGMLESAYEECLSYELREAGFKVERQKPLPIVYKEIELEYGYRVDLLVNSQIVIELKAIERLTDVHTAQVLTYLKFGNFPLGLLMNFNVKMLKQGLKRFIM
ncbi:MAG: GxxExxY protein [Lewinellaceae bacterium]|nr:GxxExxY protein [Phaeodactylibacter sp.]MCB9035760.1 GxxExxY protein [Lewinellaceae bacterium]